MSLTVDREYIRHPTTIPIQVKSRQSSQQLNLKLNNVSEGGLSFHSPRPYQEGTVVNIKIDTLRPVFKVVGIVQWCKLCHDEQYEMGIRFLDKEDAYRVRMVEQICHIEEFRQQQMQVLGRRVTRNEASYEWISRFGGQFPQ